ncbi:hypothetical protein CALVIDRAFT_220265 [Calocera viscosa TUFC12733]|uniref:Uncharacterized protein n=1 Tax=Calocera viscosa (strain TUFC12733) TaxID=1330018 RepID=A0A167RJC6_CALVF|nr:hypothetical protein CALVIDRAFT_220265 [Calocera viscosa TUFC12733]
MPFVNAIIMREPLQRCPATAGNFTQVPRHCLSRNVRWTSRFILCGANDRVGDLSRRKTWLARDIAPRHERKCTIRSIEVLSASMVIEYLTRGVTSGDFTTWISWQASAFHTAWSRNCNVLHIHRRKRVEKQKDSCCLRGWGSEMIRGTTKRSTRI